MRLLKKALTFDDVLLVPAYSAVLPKDTVLKTYPDYFGSLDDSPESYLSLRNRERLINAGQKNA